MIVLSPSAGSSQRVTGVKCIAIVSVPSGAATATDPPASDSSATTTRTRAQRRGTVHHEWVSPYLWPSFSSQRR